MKTEIKAKVQKLMDEYRTVITDIKAKIKSWEDNTIYTNDYKAGKIGSLQKEAEQFDSVFNKKMYEIITEEKKTIIGEPEAKPADYQVRISNALKFLELAGNKLTDDQAYGILKPFQNDYETMNLFKAAIDGLVEGEGIWKTFGKTFGKTNNFMTLIKSFELVEKTAAANLFDSKETGLLSAVKTNMFLDTVISIQKLANAFDAA